MIPGARVWNLTGEAGIMAQGFVRDERPGNLLTRRRQKLYLLYIN